MAYTTIDKPTNYFETLTWSGNSTDDRAISGLDFAPNWVWIKCRNNGQNHNIFDTVRGATESLESNNNNAENTDATSLKSFTSDGYTLGTGSTVNSSSPSTKTYVAWNWKAGTSFTNDASATGIGSIDSTGSTSDTSGFSIVSYTGTGSAGTIKHGLSAAPNFMIIKNRDAARSWNVYFGDPTDYMYLNDNAGAADYNEIWNDTAPTTSVFSVGTDNGVNQSGEKYIAYLFAEKQGFSKMGSYTGNGNADGPFVYTGFKPAWVMIKKTTGTNGWWGIQDNKRDPENIVDKTLYANVSDTEYSGANYYQDFLSNGFKIRTAHAGMNESAAPYIYMAFAENPFTTSTGVPATAR